MTLLKLLQVDAIHKCEGELLTPTCSKDGTSRYVGRRCHHLIVCPRMLSSPFCVTRLSCEPRQGHTNAPHRCVSGVSGKTSSERQAGIPCHPRLRAETEQGGGSCTGVLQSSFAKQQYCPLREALETVGPFDKSALEHLF